MENKHADVVQKTIDFVKKQLAGSEKGHDWWHINRVWKNAKLIGANEECELLVVELASLLHDISDPKFNGGDQNAGATITYNFLIDCELSDEIIFKVVSIVENISYAGGINKIKPDFIEFDIVQDADRLDAIGAIGIARTFHYGGFKNRELYNPDIPPKKYKTTSEYYKSESPTINHFYEKLLNINELMNTQTGKKMALSRHNFMISFLDQFFNEWSPSGFD